MGTAGSTGAVAVAGRVAGLANPPNGDGFAACVGAPNALPPKRGADGDTAAGAAAEVAAGDGDCVGDGRIGLEKKPGELNGDAVDCGAVGGASSDPNNVPPGGPAAGFRSNDFCPKKPPCVVAGGENTGGALNIDGVPGVPGPLREGPGGDGFEGSAGVSAGGVDGFAPKSEGVSEKGDGVGGFTGPPRPNSSGGVLGLVVGCCAGLFLETVETAGEAERAFLAGDVSRSSSSSSSSLLTSSSSSEASSPLIG